MVLAVIVARGAVLVGLVALLGYSLAMLTRRTTTALGRYRLSPIWSPPACIVQEARPALAEYQLSGITFASTSVC
ncbi:ABC-2 family transporter protein OS=Streptomyces microflavus OX=1919 GN=Smic_63630 PE=4 SV=1 [Streptomyces microflavus]